jgi:DNA polymerase elongation subunit (family B)
MDDTEERDCLVCPFRWDEDTTDSSTNSIIVWGLDENDSTICIRFVEFPLFCHIELPRIVSGSLFRWDSESVFALKKFLQKVMDENAPLKIMFKESEKLYYFSTKKHPTLLVAFANKSAMNHCKNLLSKERDIPGIGKMKCSFAETNISSVRKFLTLRNLSYCSWFSVPATPVSEDDKISTLPEFIADYRKCIPRNDISKVPRPKICSFDIEAYSHIHNAMPNKFFRKHVVFCISMIFSRFGTKDKVRYCLSLSDVDPKRLPEETKIFICENEKILLEKFCEILGNEDLDVLLGYNIFGFDYPYLDARLKQYFPTWPLCASRLRGVAPYFTSITWDSKAFGTNYIDIVSFPGRLSIDMIKVIKREYKLSLYRLDFVGNYFLGRGKHDMSAKDMFVSYEASSYWDEAKLLCFDSSGKPWSNINSKVISSVCEESEKARKEMSRVASYCIEDSELILDLFNRLSTWISLLEMSNITGVGMMELFSNGQQIRGVSLIYDFATKNNVVVSNPPSSQISSYGGGFVYDPNPGLYDGVICIDFNSLYPSIIIAYNICFTTYVPPERTDIPDSDCHIFDWEEDVETEDGNIPTKKRFRYRFVRESVKRGILPSLLSNLISERKKIKANMKKYSENDEQYIVLDKRQLALKLTANSMYGMLGTSKGGRLPLIEAAMCVTARGRELITKCNEYLVSKYSANIVYGDTDSTMFSFPNYPGNSPEDYLSIWSITSKFEKEVSDLFPDPLRVEVEKVGRILCLKKKKYAFWQSSPKTGELEEGKIIYRGMILARRDNSAWQRRVYANILHLIMNRSSMQSVLDEIIFEVVQLIRGNVPYTDLLIVKSLNSTYKVDSNQMKVFSEELRRRGSIVVAGERLEYLIVEPDNDILSGKKKDLLGYRMRSPEWYLESNDKIDVKYYLLNALSNCVEQLWSIAFGNLISSEVEKSKKQKYLSAISELRKCYPSRDSQIVNIYHMSNGDFVQTMRELQKLPGIKSRAMILERKFVTGRDVFSFEICPKIVCLLEKAWEKGLLEDAIRSLASESKKNQLLKQ